MINLAASFRAFCVPALLLALAGCGTLTALGDATRPSAVFELRAPAEVPLVSGRARAWDVIVEVPTTGGALQTERIMIRPDPLEAQYLPDVRWSEPTPVMVQTLMLRTLDATGAFQYVGRRPLGSAGDYAIVTELVDFHAVRADEAAESEVRVSMVARIVREQGVRILASRSFTATEPVASLDTDDLVAAFDAATARMLTEFAGWTLSSLGVR